MAGMISSKFLAGALLTAAACTAGNAAAGEWSCTNEPETGSKTKWMLSLRDDGSKWTGKLSDGEIDIALSDVKLEGGTLTFRFFINTKPYTFSGRADSGEIVGKYSGEEAHGTLRCQK